jgi:Glycolipid transfer protein (GLTP)
MGEVSQPQTRPYLHPFLILLVLPLIGTPGAEASLESLRGGSLRVCTRSRWHSKSRSTVRDEGSAVEQKPLHFLDDIPSGDVSPTVSPHWHTFSNSRRTTVKKPSLSVQTPSMRTAIADLANDFHAAIQAINQDDDDIHVGRLLNACDRLEQTMQNIGFKQGAKDIGGNIRKIRNIYVKAPPSQRDLMPALLRYEMDSGIHDNGIKDPSAAMGFLWLGRTLNYQYDMFKLMLDENEEPYYAARRAYDLDLKHHQSWAVQKVCQAAMTTLKPMKRTSMFSRFGGFEENCFGQQEHDATNRDLYDLMESWQPLLTRWKKVFSDLDLGESI